MGKASPMLGSAKGARPKSKANNRRVTPRAEGNIDGVISKTDKRA